MFLSALTLLFGEWKGIHLQTTAVAIQAFRERGSFPRPSDIWGAPPSLKNTEKGVPEASFWLEICINQFSAGAPSRIPWGSLRHFPRPSRMVRGHPSPGFLPLDALGVSISAHKNEVVIGSHDNGFSGPAAALDGPVAISRKVDQLKDKPTVAVVVVVLSS